MRLIIKDVIKAHRAPKQGGARLKDRAIDLGNYAPRNLSFNGSDRYFPQQVFDGHQVSILSLKWEKGRGK